MTDNPFLQFAAAGENPFLQFERTRKPEATLAGGARTALQGLTAATGDEIEAALRAAWDSANGADFNEAYDARLSHARKSVKDFGEARPVLATALEVAGSLPTMAIPGAGVAKAATLGGKALNAAKAGAVGGAAYGFGSGEGASDRILNAAEGGLIGAAVAPVMATVAPPLVSGVAQGVKASGRMVGNALDVSRSLQAQADERIAKAIGRNVSSHGGTMTPDQASVWLDEAVASTAVGPNSPVKPDMLPVTLADIGTGTQRLARAAEAVPGVGSDEARKTLFERHRGQYDRMYKQLKQGLGVSTSDYNKTESRIIEEQRKASKPAYAAAFLGQQRFDLSGVLGKWKLQSSIEGGDLQSALNKAIGIVEKQLRTDPYSIGALRGAQPAPRPVVKRDPMSPLTGAVQIVPGKPPAWMPLRSFDGAKRAIDSMIEKFQARGANSEVRLLTLLKNDLLKEVDGTNPLYAKARDEFSSRAELLDALRLGRSAFKGDADLTAATFKSLPTSSKKMFKIGMSQEAGLSMARKRFGEDLSLLFDRPNAQELFEEVMSKNKFERYKKMSDIEARMAQTKNFVTGNSQTARIDQDIADLNPLQAMGKAIADKGLVGAAMSKVGDWVQKAFQMREAEARLIARDLFEQDPVKQKAILARIEAQYGAAARQRLAQVVEQTRKYITGPIVSVTGMESGLSSPSGRSEPKRQAPAAPEAKRTSAFDDLIGAPSVAATRGPFDDLLSAA